MSLAPQTRLLFWFAVVVVPFSFVAAQGEIGLLIGAIAIGAVLVAVLFDALRASTALEGIRVELPKVVRLAKDRAGMIDIRVCNPRQKARRLRIGFALPDQLGPEKESETVLLPDANEWSALQWRCQPHERGRYLVSRAHLEVASPLGLWAVRRAMPVNSEVRVYPNLLTDRRQVAAVFLRRGGFGVHSQRQVGKGRDFEKLREYIPGDGMDEIHWKASAKRGHPVTKVFQIERTQEVYVAIDYSRLSGRFGGRPAGDAALVDNALERYVTSALVLGLAAEQQGDLFGLITFADRIGTFVRARNGRAHFNTCRDALYSLKPETVTPDFDEVTSFIRLRLRRRALLLFLTALDDPVLAENFVRSMDLICRQHLILVGMLKPEGAEPLFTNENAENIDDLYARLGGHMRWHRLRELDKVLGRRGVRLELLDREELSAQLVSNYVSVKQRQLI